MSKAGQLFVISGPSGAGKSTLRELLLKKFNLVYSISATTRACREGEVPGKDYEFITKAEFEQRIEAGQFLEWAKVYENYYGTPKAPLILELKAGQDVLLEIDVQGAEQIRKNISELNVSAHFIFISPPSLEILEERLRQRDTDDHASIQRRLEDAKAEIAQSDHFDLVVVNENLETALSEVEDFIRSVTKLS